MVAAWQPVAAPLQVQMQMQMQMQAAAEPPPEMRYMQQMQMHEILRILSDSHERLRAEARAMEERVRAEARAAREAEAASMRRRMEEARLYGVAAFPPSQWPYASYY